MAESDQTEDFEECSPVEQLAEQYLERLRNGERPRISEYADAHPELADEIRDVFRTLAMLEDFAPDHRDDAGFATTLSTETPTKLGEYRIVRELGRGGMGVVYEAEHGTMKRRVALKVLHARSTKKGNDLQRFLQEARSAGRLHHTNIVPVFEVGVDEDVHFYAMQCIRGQNLDLVIADLKRLQKRSGHLSGVKPRPETPSGAECLLSGQFSSSKPAGIDSERPAANSNVDDTTSFTAESDEIVLPESSDLSNVGEKQESYFHRVARVGLQVAEALAHAHEHGVLHRDIKPSNLILDTEGTIWVTDFGLARSEGEDLTHTGDIVGTLRYMAPERFRGKTDARSDIYSLGLTLYELCTLRHAFDRTERADLIRQVTRHNPEKPRRINPLIPRDLETIILKCIDREPGGRYARADALREDLQLFLADRPIDARRTSLTEQTWRWCRRNPLVAAMLSCVVTLLGVIFFGAIGFAIHTNQLNEKLRVKHDQTERARKAETRARVDEQTAYAKSRVHLYESLFRQAQAERRNQLTGRRDHSLAALKQAAEILKERQLPDDEHREQLLRLRNEAVAIFAQTGLAIDQQRTKPASDSASFFPDATYERYIVSQAKIEIREFDGNQLTKTVPQFHFRATDFVFSDDGRFMATIHRQNSSPQKFVRVWDLRKDESVLEVEADVSDICFAPQPAKGSAPSLAFRSGASTVTTYTECNPDRRRVLEFEFEVKGLAFLDADRIGVTGGTKTVEVVTVDRDSRESIPLPANGWSLACSPDSNTLAVGLQNGEIHVYNYAAEAREIAELIGHGDDVHSISLSPDGELVVSTSWDSTTRLWDVRHELELKRLTNQHLRSGFSRDGRHFCCHDPDGKTLVYEVFRNGPWQAYYDDRNMNRHHRVAFHPLNARFAAVATSAHVEFWDLKINRLVQLLKTERTFFVQFSNDGKQLLTGGRRGLRKWTVAAPENWNAVDGIDTDPITLVEHDVYDVATNDGMDRIVHVDVDGMVAVTSISDTATIEVGEPIRLGNATTMDVAISPDGRWVSTTLKAGRGLIVWDADTGSQVAILGAEDAPATTCFSPDSRWLVGGNQTRRVVWDVATWEPVRSQPRAGRSRGAVSFSPDGDTIAMPHNRLHPGLVDRTTLKTLVVLDAGERPFAVSATFSTDGSRLAFSSRENFEVWDLDDLRQRLKAMGLDWSQPRTQPPEHLEGESLPPQL